MTFNEIVSNKNAKLLFLIGNSQKSQIHRTEGGAVEIIVRKKFKKTNTPEHVPMARPRACTDMQERVRKDV